MVEQNKIADQMDISRAPIRDIARSFERNGLVTTVAHLKCTS